MRVRDRDAEARPREHAHVGQVVAEGNHLPGGDPAVARELREGGVLADAGRRELDERFAGSASRSYTVAPLAQIARPPMPASAASSRALPEERLGHVEQRWVDAAHLGARLGERNADDVLAS